MAEELSQESAMHRLVFACIVLALMAQGAWAESEDHARLVSAVSEFKQAVTDSIDLNTNQAAESYALLATAAELTPAWRELGRLALDTINSVVGLVCDLDALLTSEGGTKALEDPITFKKILKEVWMSKDPLAYLASEISLLGLVMNADSYKISFQAISDVEQLARDVYSVDKDFLSASNAAKNELWSPSKQNGLPIPLRNGPRLKEGGRNVATKWENGIKPVRQEIVNSIDSFILGIPDPLPAGYPLEENIAYLDDLTSQIRENNFHIVKFKSIEADKLRERHISLGMIREDRDAASFLYDSWLNNILEVQFKSTIVDTGETICDITSYGAKGTVKTVSKGLSDLYDIKGIIEVPGEFVNLIDKPINPLDALQDHTIKTNIDLIQETSNLWTLSAFTLDYLAKSMEMPSAHVAEDTAPNVLGFWVSPLSLNLGESFTIDYTVLDTSGSGLKQVELWRTQEKDKWPERPENPIQTNMLADETGPLTGTFTDSPSAPGKYWYGMHVVDNTGNWNDEKNSHTNNVPGVYGPIEVEVKNGQLVTLTLFVHDGDANGPIILDALVTGQDESGSDFQETTNEDGYVTISREPGTWSFSASANGYETNNWDQDITETDTKDAFLQKIVTQQNYETSGSASFNLEAPAIYWNKTFGGPYDDWANSVQQTSDGGYIIAGKIWKQGLDQSLYNNIWLIKTDTSGNEVWNKTFGKSNSGESFVQQTSDGGYIIAGDTESYGAGLQDAWLIKTDTSGNEVWNKTFGYEQSYNKVNSVQQTSDGGYIIAGEIDPYDRSKNTDFLLIKTDAFGNEIWKKTFGYEQGYDSLERANSVQQTSDGGYIIAGMTAGTYMDALLIKTDPSGNEVWNETFGGPYDDWANSVQQTSDGGYIVAGKFSTYMSISDGDVWLFETEPGSGII